MINTLNGCDASWLGRRVLRINLGGEAAAKLTRLTANLNYD